LAKALPLLCCGYKPFKERSYPVGATAAFFLACPCTAFAIR